MIREISCQQLLDKQLRFIDSWFAIPAPDRPALFEVGSVEQFNERHLPRATRLPPLPQSVDQVSGLLQDPSTEAVVYGQDAHDPLPFHWARLLEAAGYQTVYVLIGGKNGWAREGLTLQSGWVPADHFGQTLPEAMFQAPKERAKSLFWG
jgi:3-mercaptopyruvate sulfurtransferase SseA